VEAVEAVAVEQAVEHLLVVQEVEAQVVEPPLVV
jgi:hypothetical protein